jgi:hypothetical protein
MLFLAPMSAAADVIPTKTDAPDRSAATKVKSELVKRGVHPQQADQQVSKLTDRDLSYFSAQPDRIQLGAGILTEEWVLAAIFLAVITVIVIWRVTL